MYRAVLASDTMRWLECFFALVLILFRGGKTMGLIITKKEEVVEIVGAIIDLVNKKCPSQAPEILSHILKVEIRLD